MSYSTVVEVRNALSPAPDGSPWEDGDAPDSNNPTGTAADLSNDQLQDAIAEADALIDTYIGALYVAPVVNDFTGTPYLVTPHPLDYWSRNIAAYNASLTFRMSQDFTDQDPVARRWLATMAALTLVMKNQLILNIPGNVSDSAGEGAGSPVNPYYGTMFEPDDFSLAHFPAGGFPFGFGGDAYLSQLDYPWPT